VPVERQDVGGSEEIVGKECHFALKFVDVDRTCVLGKGKLVDVGAYDCWDLVEEGFVEVFRDQCKDDFCWDAMRLAELSTRDQSEAVC
jgi:hypothetical protein